MLLQALCIISYSLVNSNWSYSPETPNLGQIRRFLEPCDLGIWPSKPIGHLFYATSSFVHHFVAIGEFKLLVCPETPNLGQIRRLLEPCDLEIWRMTFKNNRAPLLCYLKLCVPFRSGIGDFKLQLQSGNAQSGSNSTIFSSVWGLNLTDEL